jgi:hypothetical protein
MDCDLKPDPDRQTVPMTDAELKSAQAECSAKLANIGQEFLEGNGERVNPIDPVMQAKERLRRCETEDPRDVYDTRKQEPGHNPAQAYPGDYSDWLASKHLECDRITLADFALSILPKGKRPVAINPETLDVGADYFRVESDLEGGLVVERGEIGLMRDVRCVNYPGITIVNEDGGFSNEADARLELYWRKLDELIALSR